MITTVCYGKEEKWESREDAMKVFFEGMVACEGCERDRYTNIYIQLATGQTECSDQRVI